MVVSNSSSINPSTHQLINSSIHQQSIMRIASQMASSNLSLPKDSYIYSVIPIHGTPILAAISSDDSLRLFDAASLRLKSDGLLDKVHDGITCLKAFSGDQSCVLTAGRDAAVRCWDLRSKQAAFAIEHRGFAP